MTAGFAATLACGLPRGAGPVPVTSPAQSVDALAGRWSGTYRADANSRRGVIRFELQPGADTARGEVEITFSPTQRLYGDPPEEPLVRRPCNIIAITLVRLEENQVRGALAAYWDPDCGCRTHTVFEGTLAGDRIEGTFSSRPERDRAPRLTGRWSAERRRR